MQLFDAGGALIGMITGARGKTITVAGRPIPKAAIARVTENRAYLGAGADAEAPVPSAGKRAPRAGTARRSRGIPPAHEPVIVPLDPRDEARLVAELGPPEGPATADHAAARRADALVVPLAEERLRVATRSVELGEIAIRKSVEAVEQVVPVTLEREEVRVRAVDMPDRPPRSGEGAFTEGVIRVPVRGEEPVVATEAVVTGEVVVDTTRVAERREIAGTVRRERVAVDRGGAA